MAAEVSFKALKNELRVRLKTCQLCQKIAWVEDVGHMKKESRVMEVVDRPTTELPQKYKYQEQNIKQSN